MRIILTPIRIPRPPHVASRRRFQHELNDETVIIQETDGTVIAQGTPDTNRNAFTLAGVPSGDHHYEIVISCDAGPENLGGFDFNIQ